MVVVGLVILDAFFVLAELLIDLSVIQLEHGHLAPEVRQRFVHLLQENTVVIIKTFYMI